MTDYERIKPQLTQAPRTWLVTGCAGFIGSNLLETLLKLGQKVVGLDNFATGHQYNLNAVEAGVTERQWDAFAFIEGDICRLEDCRQACRGVDIVLHQAALGSVPLSIEDPIQANASNVDGFVNMLVAARDAGAKRFIYAASSATYGDNEDLPKTETVIGRALSPYAVTKYVNELYADVFARLYGLETIGLRYFNIFGYRQDPRGAYAAVIPAWFAALINGEPVYINGDGETSRDFCFIEDCIQANILAATTENKTALNQIYNVAAGSSTSLNQLFELIKESVAGKIPASADVVPLYREFREGDILHSFADIGKIKELLKYEACYPIRKGLKETAEWHFKQQSIKAACCGIRTGG